MLCFPLALLVEVSSSFRPMCTRQELGIGSLPSTLLEGFINFITQHLFTMNSFTNCELHYFIRLEPAWHAAGFFGNRVL